MERLYKFVKDRDIALKYIDGLKDKYEVKGFYTNLNNKHCILLDKDLLDNPDEHQQILAEECATTPLQWGIRLRITHVNTI